MDSPVDTGETGDVAADEPAAPLPPVELLDGLPVVVTVTSGSGTVCSLAGGTVTFLAGGTCTISASQAGSSLWESAPTVDQTIEIGKMSQAITFPQPAQLGHSGGASTSGRLPRWA